jgi:hypothetical protein
VTASQKAVLSLLITVVLFGVFAALAFTGLFDLVEARFYNPSIAASINNELGLDAESIEKFISELQNRFSETLRIPAVRRSFLPNQSAEDIFERSRVYGLFAESAGGVQWIRFIDSGGARLHFSTYPPDILRQDRFSTAYSDYFDPAHPYGEIAVNSGEPAKYTIDGEEDRILFSFPFYDSFDVYRGTAVFSLSVKTLSDRLISEGRILVGQDIAVTTEPPGFLSGISAGTRKALASQAASIWHEGGLKIAGLNSQNSNLSLTLFSTKTAQGFYVGRCVNDELFRFPSAIKVILLASFFLTVYLSVFLIFNFRQDPVTIVQNRLKQLQISLIEQFYERKNDMDWNRWSRELELRRDEIHAQLKLGIKTASDSGIDTLIDKSWNELLSVMEGNKSTAIEEEKLQTILNRIIAAIPAAAIRAGTVQIAAQPAASGIQSTTVDEAEPVEILVQIGAEDEEIEEAELVEEIEEDADEVMPLSEADFSDLASQIEFAPTSETEDSGDIETQEDLEIVSPFSTMLSGFSNSDISSIDKEYENAEDSEGTDSLSPPDSVEAKKKFLIGSLKTIIKKSDYLSLPLFSKPFSNIGGAEIETLNAANEKPAINKSFDEDSIIKEREGIHYVSGEVLKPDPGTAATLNKDFKDLIDSIISSEPLDLP